MTTIAPGSPVTPDQSTQETAWHRPRTTPDGDIMPGQDGPADGGELGFFDFLDVINPLQHLPVVGTIYRALTGDAINESARMAGGALYGGPFGIVGALANIVMERESGKDFGGTALAWLTDEPGSATDTGAALAEADGVQADGTQADGAQAINAAPVTTAAAYASPAAAAAGSAASPDRAAFAEPAAAAAEDAPSATEFSGRSADRLDAFIRQANAVRRSNPLAAMHRTKAGAVTPGAVAPGAIDPARLQAAALKPPGVGQQAEGAKDGNRPDRPAAGDAAEPALALAGGDAGSLNEWMLRALEKYEHMRRQESS